MTGPSPVRTRRRCSHTSCVGLARVSSLSVVGKRRGGWSGQARSGHGDVAHTHQARANVTGGDAAEARHASMPRGTRFMRVADGEWAC
jgi:hypothetical protein